MSDRLLGLPLHSIDRTVQRRCRLARWVSLRPSVPKRLRRARGPGATRRGLSPAASRRSGARPLLRGCRLPGESCYLIHSDREILSDSWRPFAEMRQCPQYNASSWWSHYSIEGAGSARAELRQGRDPVYGAGAVERGTTEREAGERRGFRVFTVTVRMGEPGRGLLFAI